MFKVGSQGIGLKRDNEPAEKPPNRSGSELIRERRKALLKNDQYSKDKDASSELPKEA